MDSRTVVVVDDHPIFRSGVAQMISADPAYRVVAEGENGSEAVDLARHHQPDFMLLDVSMSPGGLEAISSILAASPLSRVVMLSATDEPATVARALALGAAGYLLKDTRRADLLAALAQIAQGHAHISPRLMSGLVAFQSASPADEKTRLATLTRGETRVIELLAEGLSNAEIATSLAVHEKTVKFHLSNIYEKLGVRNRVEAALFVRRSVP